MTETRTTRSVHLRGLGRLAVEATVGLTELVEDLHRTISVAPPLLGRPREGPTKGTTGFVYRRVRGVTRLVGRGVDVALASFGPLLGELGPSSRRDALLAALNGVLGDHLEATGNPLATGMTVRKNGANLRPSVRVPATGTPAPRAKLLLLVHGLCTNEEIWRRGGHDLGAALERDVGLAAVYLRYNSGRHVSTNGRELAQLLEAFLASEAVPPADLVIVAHSMGGLVTRSALCYGVEAGHAWPRSVRAVVFLGTPHHGAPLERAGNLVQAVFGVSPYSHPFARLGKIRSAGITDLRHGDLLDEDWEGEDRFAHRRDARRPVPLPRHIAGFAVAGTTTTETGRPGGRLAGDGLVPVASALGHHVDPERTLLFLPGRTWIAPGTGHFDLLSRPEVYACVRAWIETSLSRR